MKPQRYDIARLIRGQKIARRSDRRPIRYQQWPYEIIVGGALVYLVGYGLWKAGEWMWGLF